MPTSVKRRCTCSPTCPAMLPPGQRYCADGMRRYETRRGTSAQRGYDYRHQKLRAKWQRVINDAVQVVRCSRCGRRIAPGSTDWDLDHDGPARRRVYLGPSCAVCNRRAGGRLGAAAAR